MAMLAETPQPLSAGFDTGRSSPFVFPSDDPSDPSTSAAHNASSSSSSSFAGKPYGQFVASRPGQAYRTPTINNIGIYSKTSGDLVRGAQTFRNTTAEMDMRRGLYGEESLCLPPAKSPTSKNEPKNWYTLHSNLELGTLPKDLSDRIETHRAKILEERAAMNNRKMPLPDLEGKLFHSTATTNTLNSLKRAQPRSTYQREILNSAKNNRAALYEVTSKRASKGNDSIFNPISAIRPDVSALPAEVRSAIYTPASFAVGNKHFEPRASSRVSTSSQGTLTPEQHAAIQYRTNASQIGQRCFGPAAMPERAAPPRSDLAQARERVLQNLRDKPTTPGLDKSRYDPRGTARSSSPLAASPNIAHLDATNDPGGVMRALLAKGTTTRYSAVPAHANLNYEQLRATPESMYESYTPVPKLPMSATFGATVPSDKFDHEPRRQWQHTAYSAHGSSKQEGDVQHVIYTKRGLKVLNPKPTAGF